MQSANRLQLALRKGGPSFGAWQMLPGTNISRTLAQAGPDWICVDTEHGNISDDHMHEATAAIAACDISPVVRIASNESWMVKRALDAGAHGIIVPLIYTADDARKVISAAKFPPLGTRGFGSPFPMEKFRASTAITNTDYLVQANGALVTIIQIETREALANVDEIAAIPGCDVLLIGPFDLGNNLGHPILNGDMDEELKSAIAKIHDAAKKAGKKTGIYCTSGEQAREYADRGFHMICAVTDVPALAQSCKSALDKAKKGADCGQQHIPYRSVMKG